MATFLGKFGRGRIGTGCICGTGLRCDDRRLALGHWYQVVGRQCAWFIGRTAWCGRTIQPSGSRTDFVYSLSIATFTDMAFQLVGAIAWRVSCRQTARTKAQGNVLHASSP